MVVKNEEACSTLHSPAKSDSTSSSSTSSEATRQGAGHMDTNMSQNVAIPTPQDLVLPARQWIDPRTRLWKHLYPLLEGQTAHDALAAVFQGRDGEDFANLRHTFPFYCSKAFIALDQLMHEQGSLLYDDFLMPPREFWIRRQWDGPTSMWCGGTGFTLRSATDSPS